MSDLKTSIILDLVGNIERQADRFSKGLGRLGTRGSASMRLLSGATAAAGRGLDSLGNRYTGMITGAAGIGAVKMVGDLEERFVRLGIQANKGADEINDLKKEIYAAAQSPDIRVDPGQITSAIEEIVEKTGDLKFARANIRNIGLALQATGADGAAIGGILAEFQKMGMGAKDAFTALDILNVQGKEGAFTLANLAALGPRVVTAYTAMGRTGVPAIREMGAALQMIRQGTGSSEMAATAFEGLLRTLGDADKLKILQAGGIQVFEPGSTTIMRSLPDIMEDIIKKTGGSKVALSKVFDAEAIRAFNAAAGEFQRGGKIESLQKFYQVQADGTTLTKDSIRAANTFNATLTNLYTVGKKFGDDQLSGPIKDLTGYLNGLEPGTVERWLKVGTAITGVVGAAVAIRKGIEYGKFFKDLAAPAKLATAGAAGGKFGSAIPVYVVNGAMSTWNAPDGVGGAPGAGGKAAGIASKAGKVLGTAAAVTGTGLLGYEVGGLLNEYLIGGISSYFSKGKYKGAGALGDLAYDAFHPESKPVEVGGTLKIEITGAEARVKTLERKGGMDLNVNTGLNTAGR